MKKHIALIDFGAGNLHSVHKALKFVGVNVEITNDSNVINKSDAVVFPGVGAFGSTMDSIRKNNLEEIVIKLQKSSKPFLGICMGMQVLFEEGEENPGVKGLGIFKGKVIRFKKAKKVPHIGWNEVIARSPPWRTTKQSRSQYDSTTIIDWDCFAPYGARNDTLCQFYFVHSYYIVPEDKSIIAGETEYDGEKFVSAIKKDNLFAVQFHPEKSGEAGLELLKNFRDLS